MKILLHWLHKLICWKFHTRSILGQKWLLFGQNFFFANHTRIVWRSRSKIELGVKILKLTCFSGYKYCLTQFFVLGPVFWYMWKATNQDSLLFFADLTRNFTYVWPMLSFSLKGLTSGIHKKNTTVLIFNLNLRFKEPEGQRFAKNGAKIFIVEPWLVSRPKINKKLDIT